MSMICIAISQYGLISDARSSDLRAAAESPVAVTDPDDIAAELHGARASPRPSSPRQSRLFMGSMG